MSLIKSDLFIMTWWNVAFIIIISFPLTYHLRTKGTVLLYKETGDKCPSITQLGVSPTKTRVTVTSTLRPVVEAVAHYYSIIQSSGMFAILQFKRPYLLLYFVVYKIYIYDEADGIWEVKGCYEQVVKDNEEIRFAPHDTYGHVLSILIVSSTFLLCVLSFFKHLIILLVQVLGATRVPRRCDHQHHLSLAFDNKSTLL